VQHSLHSSSEPSPGSQTGMPPFWSASWQQHQQQTQKAIPGGREPSSSNLTSRVLSPVGGSFLGMHSVAGAAVGAGQGLTPAALAAAAAGSDVPEATAERLQQLLRDGQDLHDEEAEHQTTPQTTPRAVPRTVGACILSSCTCGSMS
jgi:outer membrane lipoprotein SlyB